MEATGTLAATIESNGSVRDLRVVKPLGLGLDEAAKAAAAQWSFEPGRTKDGPEPMLTTMELSFLSASKQSHWHLVGVEFASPDGTSRPHLVSAKYPRGSGISAEAADQARLVGAMGRQECVQLSFDIDAAGLPIHVFVQKGHPRVGQRSNSFSQRLEVFPGQQEWRPGQRVLLKSACLGRKTVHREFAEVG